MKLVNINKYILQSIFSYINITSKLNIIKYNKKLMSKLDITKYTYQKKYFYSIISPGLLIIPEILVENKIFDEKTFKKLRLDLENDMTEIINENDCFHLYKQTISKDIKNNQILNISFKDINILKNNMPNLIELNLFKIKDLELPCSILLNLKSLSLNNITYLKFILMKIKFPYLN